MLSSSSCFQLHIRKFKRWKKLTPKYGKPTRKWIYRKRNDNIVFHSPFMEIISNLSVSASTTYFILMAPDNRAMLTSLHSGHLAAIFFSVSVSWSLKKWKMEIRCGPLFQLSRVTSYRFWLLSIHFSRFAYTVSWSFLSDELFSSSTSGKKKSIFWTKNRWYNNLSND